MSAANDCFYCMDSHGAFASALLELSGAAELLPLIDAIMLGSSDGSTTRCVPCSISRGRYAASRYSDQQVTSFPR